MRKSNTEFLKKWLKREFYFVPLAYLFNFVYAIQQEESGGTFGDTFGAANALFSGTALLMLIMPVLFQTEELEVVKEERDDTKTLLKGQEEINKQQEKALHLQRFNQGFFSILSLIGEQRKSLN